MQDGVIVEDFIICLLAFSNIFIYLFIFYLIKKRGVQKGVQKEVQKGVQKGGPEGRVHVLSTRRPASRCLLFLKVNSSKQEIAQSFLSTAKFSKLA